MKGQVDLRALWQNFLTLRNWFRRKKKDPKVDEPVYIRVGGQRISLPEYSGYRVHAPDYRIYTATSQAAMHIEISSHNEQNVPRGTKSCSDNEQGG